MAIPGWVAQWATAASFVVAIITGTLGLYQLRIHLRRERQAKDDRIRLDTEERAQTRFDIQDHEEKIRENTSAIRGLETRVAHLEGSK